MIRFENVNKNYGKKEILKDLSFEIEPGEFVVLIGPSGCGKTTTLKSINRLIEPDSGTIYVNGQDNSKIDKVKLRRGIGYVIQQIGLFPNMTVAENIAVVPKRLKFSKEEIDKITRELMEMSNLPYEEYADKYPSELSGGQQQRIGVLRALAAQPPIVLMDEPFGALDPMTRKTLQNEVSKLHKKLKKTFVLVTHDMDEALELADKIIFMENGKIVQMATPDEMLANPGSDLVREFLGKQLKDPVSLTAADVLRENVVTVYKNRSQRECTGIMARHNIDSLLVKNDDDTYLGTVTVNNMRKYGIASGVIGDLASKDNVTAYIDEDAQSCFDKLLDSEDNYVVVLNHDNTIAGIITKTSIVKSMKDTIWGEEA